MDPLYLSFSGGNITKALQVAHHCFDKYTLAFRLLTRIYNLEFTAGGSRVAAGRGLLAAAGWEIEAKSKISVSLSFNLFSIS